MHEHVHLHRHTPDTVQVQDLGVEGLSHRELQTMQGKAKRRRDLQYLLLGMYFRDLTLGMSLSSQSGEAGPHVHLAQLLL